MIRRVGRPSLMFWDTDYQGVKVKDIYLQLEAFKQFVRDGIKSTEGILKDHLFFGMDLPTFDLNEIVDNLDEHKPSYSFLKNPTNKLPNGREYMSELMKSAHPSKNLMDEQGRWDIAKVKKYLEWKKKFLRKLMKGISLVSFTHN